MRLTPQDIHHKKFKRSMRGYSDVEVDLFLDEVYEEFERLYKENHELKDEAEKLRDRVERYEKLEKTLNETLISAQRSAEEIRDKANLDAETLLNEANEKVELAVTGASAEAARLESNLSELIETEKTFRSELKKFILGFAARIDEVSARVEPDTATGIDQVADNESFPGIDAEEEEEDIDVEGIESNVADLDVEHDVAADSSSGYSEAPASSSSESDLSSSSAADSFFKAMTVENAKFAAANVSGNGDRSSHQMSASAEQVDPVQVADPEKTQEFDQASLHNTGDYSKGNNDSDSSGTGSAGISTSSSDSGDETGSFSISSGTSSFWGKRSEEKNIDQAIIAEGTMEVKDNSSSETANSTSSVAEDTSQAETASTSTPGGIYLSDNIHNFISGEKIVRSDEEVEESKKEESPSNSMFGSYRKDDN